MSTDQVKYKAPALEKGLDIIEALSKHVDGMTQGEIAKTLDRSSGEIYRMLDTLVRRGYVVRLPHSELYSLSLRLFSLSQRHPPTSRLLEYAAPLMRKFAKDVWQSCHLGAESGGDIVVIASAEAPGNWGLSMRVGTSIGLANTGTGRVLAAFRSDEELKELIDSHRPAEGEPGIKRAEFMKTINRIRKLGYERMPSATAMGVTNLSYPVFGPKGDAVAALTCPYLERIDDLQVPDSETVQQKLHELATTLHAFFGA